MIIGIENMAHHTATDTKDILMAIVALGIPNISGYWYMRTLIKKSKPPPIYPMEKPSEEA
jgi:hypothetical protein